MRGEDSIPGCSDCLQRGLTLIEVMIALLVLSIGLIGIAALTLFGLQSVHSSYQSSLASVIALDAEEWLWEAFGDDRLTSCGDLSSVVDAVNDRWFPGVEVTGAVPITLPNGSVTLVPDTCAPPTIGPYGCWIRGQIEVAWAEARFIATRPAPEDTGDPRESFLYWVQIPCTEAGS